MRGSVRRAAALATLALLSPSLADAVIRRAFATSTTYDGNLAALPGAGSVLAKADAECQARADAAALGGAPFRAWLSGADADAYCHVQGLTGFGPDCGGLSQPQLSGPWFRIDGAAPFAGRLDELTTGLAVYLPVQFDEEGVTVTGALDGDYWTGTGPGGDRLLNTCEHWTSSAAPEPRGEVGLADTTSASWTSATSRTCDQPARLLCLESGAADPFAPTWTPGHIVFVSSVQGSGAFGGATWPESGGIGGIFGADTVCRHLAAAARLPHAESFVAWLSDTQTDARDRFAGGAGPFVRLDGFVVAADLDDFTDGSLGASIHLDETGAYLDDEGRAWTGTSAAGTLDTNHCSDWSSEAGSGVSGGAGQGTYLNFNWTEQNSYVCSLGNRVYCVAQLPTLFWDGFEYLARLGRWSAAQP